MVIRPMSVILLFTIFASPMSILRLFVQCAQYCCSPNVYTRIVYSIYIILLFVHWLYHGCSPKMYSIVVHPIFKLQLFVQCIWLLFFHFVFMTETFFRFFSKTMTFCYLTAMLIRIPYLLVEQHTSMLEVTTFRGNTYFFCIFLIRLTLKDLMVISMQLKAFTMF